MFPFSDMNPNSRVWIYQADQKIDQQKQQLMKQELSEFTSQWRAHMKQLMADFDIVYDQFIFIVVDEAMAEATGCSIDSSVHLIMEFEKKYQLSLLNRMLLSYRDGDEIKIIKRSDFSGAIQNSTIGNDTVVFNNTIQHVSEIDDWEVPMKSSWHAEAFA